VSFFQLRFYEGVYYSKDLFENQQFLEELLAPDSKGLNVDQEIFRVFGKNEVN
jgi:hypothetical protein